MDPSIRYQCLSYFCFRSSYNLSVCFIHRVLIPRVFPLSLFHSSSLLLLPSLPSSYNPPPLLLSPPRRESLPAMRKPSNRAATCMSTVFHRLDAHQPQSTHHSTPLKPYSTFFQQFSAAVSFRIGVFFCFSCSALRNCFAFGAPASSFSTSLAVLSGSHGNQPADG